MTASTQALCGIWRLPPGPDEMAALLPPSTFVSPLPPMMAAIATWGSVKPPMSLMNAFGASQPMKGPLMKL